MAEFDKYAYVSDDGDRKPIRLSNETATAGGFGAGTNLDDRDYVIVSKSNRQFGLRPRMLSLRRREGGAIKYRRLPMATVAEYNSAISDGSISVGGATWIVIAGIPEDV